MKKKIDYSLKKDFGLIKFFGWIDGQEKYCHGKDKRN